MRVFTILEDNVERARAKLLSDLGAQVDDVKLLNAERGRCSFQVFQCPPSIDVEISRDGMKATITRLRLPIGEKAPKLNTDYLVELLKGKGITSGLKFDHISQELYRVLNTPGFDDAQALSIVAAEGIAPVSGQAGRPQWMIDIKLFQKREPVFARKGDILARAGNANPGVEGRRVTGEVIKPVIEEQFRLNVGAGIEIQQQNGETIYVAKTFGRLFFDEGVRMRLQAKIIEGREGLDATIEAGLKSFAGQRITGQELLDFAKENGVSFGLLKPEEIDAQLRSFKLGFGIVVLGRGQDAKDGAPGEVVHLYKKSLGLQALDEERAKERIVFPGEDILLMKGPSLPVDGKTAYGELLRGRPYSELALYPGKGVSKEKIGEDIIFKAVNYGRVVVDKDRVTIQNIATVSKDKMKVVADIFPQKLMSSQDMLNLLRDLDVLFGFDKDQLEMRLIELYRKGERVTDFVLAEGIYPIAGGDARVTYAFDREELKEKGLFSKKAGKKFLAAPGDLLLTKTLPIDAKEGTNVFREKVSVPKTQLPKDIRMVAGKGVKQKEIGEEGNKANPLRVEYRSEILGILVFKDGMIDVSSVTSISKDEREARMLIQANSDFGTPIDEQMIKKIAEDEGIKVDLEWPSIRKALMMSSTGEVEGGTEVVIARALDPVHGENAKIQYFVEFNGKPLDGKIGSRRAGDEKPTICDCVRPGDVVAMKTPPGVGVDGKTIFGRRLAADRGSDEAFVYGSGIDKSKDGMQLFVSLTAPGFIFVENAKLVARSTVTIAKDKMSATISIFPSKNPRFMIREDKLMSMIQGIGINYGVKTRTLREAIEEVVEAEKPVLNLVIAEGRPPEKGRDASFRYAIDLGDGVGEIRDDGSIDYKNKNVFQSVKQGHLLMIKQPPAMGADGVDVCGNILQGKMGADSNLQPGPGVVVSANGLEYRAGISGILEVVPKSIRVIPGLFIDGDVGNKTGNIHSAASQVFIKGGVLPDFEVSSDADINIEKVAEACKLMARGNIKVRGGIIGKGRGYSYAGGNIDAHYVSAGATVEAEGDVTIHSEVLNARIVTGSFLICEEGAGAIVGGEIFSKNGVKAKVLGAAGAETPTVLNLGQNILELRRADQEARKLGIVSQIERLQKDLATLSQELRSIYDSIPEVMKRSHEDGQKLQNDYRVLFERRQERSAELEELEKRRAEILAKVPVFKDFVVTVSDLIHPGTTFVFGAVRWVLKESLRGVEIRWNVATSNFISRRL